MCLTKADDTDPNAHDVEKVVTAYKYSVNERKAEVSKMEDDLASTQEKWKCSRKDQTTAADRLVQGIKATEATVAQYNIATSKKRHWNRMAAYAQMRPDESPWVMDGHSVAAEDLHEAALILAHDLQDVAP